MLLQQNLQNVYPQLKGPTQRSYSNPFNTVSPACTPKATYWKIRCMRKTTGAKQSQNYGSWRDLFNRSLGSSKKNLRQTQWTNEIWSCLLLGNCNWEMHLCYRREMHNLNSFNCTEILQHSWSLLLPYHHTCLTCFPLKLLKKSWPRDQGYFFFPTRNKRKHHFSWPDSLLNYLTLWNFWSL